MGEFRSSSRQEALQEQALNCRLAMKHRLDARAVCRQKAWEALQEREQEHLKLAQLFLLDLNARAGFRDSIEARARQEKEAQALILEREGQLYRQKLRKYLRQESVDKRQ